MDKEVLDLSRPDEIIRVLISLRVQGLQVLGWRASLHHPFHVGETQLNFLSCEPAQKNEPIKYNLLEYGGNLS